MEKQSVEAIVQALNASGARYLVAGGLAVVAHGYLRLTVDVDILLDLDEQALRRALAALTALGYHPRLPVAAEAFADPTTRAAWVRERNLVVFTLVSDAHRTVAIDIFASAPIDFEAAYARAAHLEIAPGVKATFVHYEDLVSMKKAAARPKDLLDLAQLQKLREGGYALG